MDVQWNVSHNLDLYTSDDKPARFNIPDVILEIIESCMNYSYRPNIRTTHIASFIHQYIVLADTVLQLNPHYWVTICYTETLSN